MVSSEHTFTGTARPVIVHLSVVPAWYVTFIFSGTGGKSIYGEKFAVSHEITSLIPLSIQWLQSLIVWIVFNVG